MRAGPACELAQAMAAETVKGMERMGANRRMTSEGGDATEDAKEKGSGSASSASGSQMIKAMGNLPETVGEGEHSKPLVEAMKMHYVDSWDCHRDCQYVISGMRMKDVYLAKCKEVRGKGVDLGNIRNYLFMGLYLQMKEDKDMSREEMQVMADVVGNKLRDATGTLDVARAKNLSDLVSHCSIVRTKKKGFVNVAMRQTEEGDKVRRIIRQTMGREGTLQKDVLHSAPEHGDLREALRKARAGK